MCQSGDRKIELVSDCVGGGERERESEKKNKVAFGKIICSSKTKNGNKKS